MTENRGTIGFSKPPQQCCFEGCKNPAYFYRIEGITVIPNDKKEFYFTETFKRPFCKEHERLVLQ